MWRHRIRWLSQVAQQASQNPSLKSQNPGDKMNLSQRIAWITSTGLIFGSSYILFQYSKGQYKTKLPFQEIEPEVGLFDSKQQPVLVSEVKEIPQETIDKTLEEIKHAKEDQQQQIQKMQTEEEEEISKEQEIKEEQTLISSTPKLDTSKLTEQEKNNLDKLSALAEEIIQKSKDQKQEKGLEEHLQPLPNEQQQEFQQYLRLYEEHLKYLQEKTEKLQNEYDKSVNTVQRLGEYLPALQEQIQQKDQEINHLEKNVDFSVITFNLLMKLQNDAGDISADLKECKQIKDELIQQAYRQFIVQNYQYLAEQGVPSKLKIIQMFKDLKYKAFLSYQRGRNSNYN